MNRRCGERNKILRIFSRNWKIWFQELEEKGFKVLRLWEREINNLDLNKFKDKILGVD